MPHCHSPAKRALRRERALRLGYIRPVPQDRRYVAAPMHLASRARSMIRSMILHDQHNVQAGQCWHFARCAAHHAGLPPHQLSAALTVHRAANRAKHSWDPAPKNHDLVSCATVVDDSTRPNGESRHSDLVWVGDPWASHSAPSRAGSGSPPMRGVDSAVQVGSAFELCAAESGEQRLAAVERRICLVEKAVLDLAAARSASRDLLASCRALAFSSSPCVESGSPLVIATPALAEGARDELASLASPSPRAVLAHVAQHVTESVVELDIWALLSDFVLAHDDGPAGPYILFGGVMVDHVLLDEPRDAYQWLDPRSCSSIVQPIVRSAWAQRDYEDAVSLAVHFLAKHFVAAREDPSITKDWDTLRECGFRHDTVYRLCCELVHHGSMDPRHKSRAFIMAVNVVRQFVGCS